MATCPSSRLDRRQFSVRSLYGLTALMGLGISTPAAIYLFGSPSARESGWIDAGAIPGIPEGQPVELPIVRIHRDGWKITAEQDSVWVVKKDGKLTAFSPRCTHLGCAYHWDTVQRVFVCPCHGSVFSQTGAVISGPAPRPLDRFVTRIDGDRLWLGKMQDNASQERQS